MKAQILRIGQAYIDEEGNQIITNWHIGPCAIGFNVRTGEVSGYAFEELQAITKQEQNRLSNCDFLKKQLGLNT